MYISPAGTVLMCQDAPKRVKDEACALHCWCIKTPPKETYVFPALAAGLPDDCPCGMPSGGLPLWPPELVGHQAIKWKASRPVPQGGRCAQALRWPRCCPRGFLALLRRVTLDHRERAAPWQALTGRLYNPFLIWRVFSCSDRSGIPDDDMFFTLSCRAFQTACPFSRRSSRSRGGRPAAASAAEARGARAPARPRQFLSPFRSIQMLIRYIHWSPQGIWEKLVSNATLSSICFLSCVCLAACLLDDLPWANWNTIHSSGVWIITWLVICSYLKLASDHGLRPLIQKWGTPNETNA